MVGIIVKYTLLAAVLAVTSFLAGLPLYVAVLISIVLALLGIFGIVGGLVDMVIVLIALGSVGIIAVAETTGLTGPEIVRSVIDGASSVAETATGKSDQEKSAPAADPTATGSVPAAPSPAPAESKPATP